MPLEEARGRSGIPCGVFRWPRGWWSSARQFLMRPRGETEALGIDAECPRLDGPVAQLHGTPHRAL